MMKIKQEKKYRSKYGNDNACCLEVQEVTEEGGLRV